MPHETLVVEHWTLDAGRWTLDAGRWTLDAGRWTLDAGRWTLDAGRWTLDAGRWTLEKHNLAPAHVKLLAHFNYVNADLYSSSSRPPSRGPVTPMLKTPGFRIENNASGMTDAWNPPEVPRRTPDFRPTPLFVAPTPEPGPSCSRIQTPLDPGSQTARPE
ncbi:hypothetical protein [Spongiibacter taiwanensis]